MCIRDRDGSVEIQGRPLNSFYSYKFHGLNASNGLPMFYGSDRYQYVGNQKVDLLKKYQELSPSEVFTDVMEYSGTRVPTLQGGVQNSLSWRRFSVSLNLTYLSLIHIYPVYTLFPLNHNKQVFRLDKKGNNSWHKA